MKKKSKKVLYRQMVDPWNTPENQPDKILKKNGLNVSMMLHIQWFQQDKKWPRFNKCDNTYRSVLEMLRMKQN